MTELIARQENAGPVPLRQYLRERTAEIHNELDASVGVLDSMERYACYLNGQFVLRQGMEAILENLNFPAWFGSWRPRPLAAALRADIGDLSRGVPGTRALPSALRHRMETASGLVGVLYVLEGASLGARFIYRSAKALGLSATSGARHLELQADGESWRGFLDILGREGIHREEAAQAAIAAFEYARGAFVKEMHVQS